MTLREHPDVISFGLAARRYCALLETMPSDKDLWVESILSALAELYATAHRLPEVTNDPWTDIPDSLDVSTEEWRSLFTTVQSILGQQELYWAYFDPSEPQDSKDEPMWKSGRRSRRHLR